MRLNNNQKFMMLQKVSENFLTEPIPDNWNISTGQKHRFIDVHVLERHEGTPPEEILELITDGADNMVRWIEKNL